MRHNPGGVIGGSGGGQSDNADYSVPDYLTPCPCGADATWWREGVSPAGGEAPRTADDLNLCDECFEAAIPPAERSSGWHRLSPEQEKIRRDRQHQRQHNSGGGSQLRPGTTAADSQVPHDW